MSNIKEHFTSRFSNGWLLEADYSQLEINALAVLSADPQLKSDLRKGIDLHSLRAQELFGKGFTPEQRRIAKALSFQLQYGSGPANMARTNGVPIEVAKKFIKNYYSRYPYVKEYQENLLRTVARSRVSTSKKTPAGYPAGKSILVSCTGRRYTFVESDDKYGKAGDTNFSATQVKNWQVQGFATGDIVPMMVGKLYRALKNNRSFDDKVLLINTIHDSIILDCYDHMYAADARDLVKEVLSSAPEELFLRFGVRFDLPLNVDTKTGRNWLEMS